MRGKSASTLDLTPIVSLPSLNLREFTAALSGKLDDVAKVCRLHNVPYILLEGPFNFTYCCGVHATSSPQHGGSRQFSGMFLEPLADQEVLLLAATSSVTKAIIEEAFWNVLRPPLGSRTSIGSSVYLDRLMQLATGPLTIKRCPNSVGGPGSIRWSIGAFTDSQVGEQAAYLLAIRLQDLLQLANLDV